MTIYSEVLRIALASGEAQGVREASVPMLVTRLLDERAHLAEDAALHKGAPGDPVERMALELAHDVALVRLCGALGIEEHLTDPASPLDERARLLRLVEGHEASAAPPRDAHEVGPPGGADMTTPMYSPG